MNGLQISNKFKTDIVSFYLETIWTRGIHDLGQDGGGQGMNSVVLDFSWHLNKQYIKTLCSTCLTNFINNSE